ncbi:MAG: DUF2007 domain-containing protein [Sphingomonas sp.]|uniref:putative signal transducing protein n=1 Tax=Sphingomonas sp. TaxID=28214 RepID=UPI0025EFCB4C|nr:DUF2007 domain-containing protein [Sphingomonas sp.]MBX3565456.1 DUF2007 domain-containing protein [Sphingomonas sp.]
MALVELGRFDRQEAYIVQSRLEDAGIMSFIFDADSSLMYGSYLIQARVMVDDEDLTAAREVAAKPA